MVVITKCMCVSHVNIRSPAFTVTIIHVCRNAHIRSLRVVYIRVSVLNEYISMVWPHSSQSTQQTTVT